MYLFVAIQLLGMIKRKIKTDRMRDTTLSIDTQYIEVGQNFRHAFTLIYNTVRSFTVANGFLFLGLFYDKIPPLVGVIESQFFIAILGICVTVSCGFSHIRLVEYIKLFIKVGIILEKGNKSGMYNLTRQEMENIKHSSEINKQPLTTFFSIILYLVIFITWLAILFIYFPDFTEYVE